MAGKPEHHHHHHHLQQQQSTQQSSVQNVVVYVSDNNFAYAVNQQHHNVYPQQQNGGGSFGSAVVMPTGGKGTVSKPPHQGKDFSPGNGPVSANFYGAGAPMQANGFHPCHSANYGGVNSVSTFKSPVQEVLQDGYSLQRTFFERQKSETQIDQTGAGLMAVVGESSNNGVFPRCDSVRSETAESSCSSLSSGDSQLENGQTTFIQKQQTQQLSNVVLAVTPSVQAQPSQSVSVPFGWKRLHIGGSIVYISPSNTALSSLEHLKVYLQTQGTCKCGLECPLQCEVVFNFDPKVVTRPWSAESGDSEPSGRMCQHKRKLMSMARPKKIGAESVMDAASLKRKKRKLGNSGAVTCNSSVSQLLATREQSKTVWDANVTSPVGISQTGVTRPQLPPPPPPPNFDQVHHHQQQQQQQQPQQQQQQFVRYQTPIDPSNTVMQQHQYQDIQQLRMHMYQSQLQQHQEQQKVIQQQVRPQFPPTSVPGCPQPSYESYHRLQHTNQQQMILTNSGSNTGGSPQLVMTNSGNLLNNNVSNNVNSNGGMLLIPHQQQPQRTPPWQTRAGNNCASNSNNSNTNNNNMVVGNGYERVPPLHHHTPPPHSWTEDSTRKKHKTPKSATSPAGGIKKQRSPEPAPNIDVRQLPSDGNRSQGAYQPSTGPSFMEDPSGYLAQQTALLNSTISRQTAPAGGNSNFVCHSPQQQQQQQPQPPQQQQPQTQIMMGLPQAVPLPSNVLLPKGYNPRSTVSASIQQQSVAVSSYSIQQPATSYSIQQNPQQTVTVSSYSIQQPNQQPVVSSYSVQQSPQQTVTSYNIHQQPHQAMTVSSFNIQHQQHAQHQQTMSSYSIQQHQPQQQQAVAVSSYNIQQQHHPPQQAMIHISVPPDSSVVQQQESTQHCQGCAHDAAVVYQQDRSTLQPQFQIQFQQNRSTETGNSASEDNPVTSSTFSDRSCGNNNLGRQIPDTRGPIQGGTVSTSNVSPVEACYSTTLLPQPEASPTSSSTPTPRQTEGNILISSSSPSPFNASPPGIVPYQYQQQQQQRNNGGDRQPRLEAYCQHAPEQGRKFTTTVTTMASGHTVSSNTITSVLAGRAQTATVSVGGSPADIPQQQQIQQQQQPQQQSKSPLEMVQSVVSSIQVPQQMKQQPPTAAGQLPPGHILVSSGGQLLVAQPQPQPQQPGKSMLSGVSAAVSQVGPWQPLATLSPVIPAAVGVVGQPATVLVNTLPAPLLIQPGVMAVDGAAVQIPHLAVGNMLQQSPQLVDTNDNRGQTTPGNFHPQHQQPQQRLHTHHTIDANTNGRKKSTKKRKVSPQTVASMLHIAQQNQSLVLPQPQQGYASTQGLGTMLTIVPGKGGAPAQIVMGNSGQPPTAQAPPQQPPPPAPQPAPAPAAATASINLLQPVNLAAGTVVQNFPAFQQFIVPGLGGMVMAADGTATLLPDANLGVQLQLQSVNGQSVLTPVQTSPHGFGQPGLPAGMVIRGTPATGTAPASATNTGKFLSPSNGTQFLVNSATFGGQLSPLVANVSPTQHHQVAFQTQSPAPSVQPQRPPPQQEFLPCAPAAPPHQAPSHHNTTVVQQNTTIVQQQTTMVSNSQQLLHNNFGATGNGNFVQNYQPQPTTHLRQQPQPHTPMMKHSVSTQTAVNQSVQVSNSPPNQSVVPPTTLSVATSNTFCQTSGTVGGGSPPDTTTHSPAADTTTEGLASPCPVTGSGDSNNRVRQQAPSSGSTMPMVHCVSSSNEQDSLGPDFDWTAARPPFVESSSASNMETFSKQDMCRKRKVEGQPHSLEEEEEEVAN